MNTDLLREFMAFAECLNYTVAARKLHISQPTLSRHLADLEKDLGADLVTHEGSIRLTYAGETLLGQASRLLRCEADLREAVNRATAQKALALRLEYYPFMSPVMAATNRALNIMQECHPDIHFTIDFAQPRKQTSIAESIASGYFDIGVLAHTTEGPADIRENPGICIYPLPSCRSKICFFVSKANPLAQQESIRFSQLDGSEVLFPINLEFQNFKEDIDALFAARGISCIEIPYRLGDMSEFAYMDMGMRVHILTEADLSAQNSPYLANPRARVIRCEEDIASTPYFLFRAEENPAVDFFLEALDEVFETDRSGS